MGKRAIITKEEFGKISELISSEYSVVVSWKKGCRPHPRTRLAIIVLIEVLCECGASEEDVAYLFGRGVDLKMIKNKRREAKGLWLDEGFREVVCKISKTALETIVTESSATEKYRNPIFRMFREFGLSVQESTGAACLIDLSCLLGNRTEVCKKYGMSLTSLGRAIKAIKEAASRDEWIVRKLSKEIEKSWMRKLRSGE